MSTKDVRDSGLAPPLSMIMLAANHNVWQLPCNGNSSLLLLNTPNTEPTLACRTVPIGTFTVELAGDS